MGIIWEGPRQEDTCKGNVTYSMYIVVCCKYIMWQMVPVSPTGPLAPEIGAACHIIIFIQFYKLKTTLIMNFLTCCLSLVNKTHCYWGKTYRMLLNIANTICNLDNDFDLLQILIINDDIFRPSIHWHLPCSICMEREHEYVVKWQSFINQVQT